MSGPVYGRSPDEILDDERLAIAEAVQLVEPVFSCDAVRRMMPDWKAWTLEELLEIDFLHGIRHHLYRVLCHELRYYRRWDPRSLRRFEEAADRLLAI